MFSQTKTPRPIAGQVIDSPFNLEASRRRFPARGLFRRYLLTLAGAAALCVSPMSGSTLDTVNVTCDATAQKNRRLTCVIGYFTEASAQAGLVGYRDVQIRATFTQGAITRTTFAAWDGEEGTSASVRYVIRMFLPTLGDWSWSLHCDAGPCGLVNSKSGTIGVSEPEGNPVYTRGMPFPITYNWTDLGTAQPRSWVGLGQGSPVAPSAFSWVGDSAWAAPIRVSNSGDTAWQDYLGDRSTRGFTVIHLGPAPYWAFPEGDNEALAFDTILTNCNPVNSEEVAPERCSRPNLAFWRKFEDLIQSVNDHGMIPFVAGVMEPTGSRRMSDPDDPGDPDWTGDSDYEDDYDEDRYPRIADARTFARFLAARLAGNVVILSPGFDSRPDNLLHNGESVRGLMLAVGTELKRVAPHLLVTNHFGTANVSEINLLQGEPWIDFQMFQSGALVNKPESSQLTLVLQRAQKMPGQLLAGSPQKGVLNGEAIYDEGEPVENDTSGRTYHRNAYRSRETMYLTWLNGSFGHTIGVGGIWDWNVCSLAEGIQPVHCDKHRSRKADWDEVSDILEGDPDEEQQSSRSAQYWGELLRSVGPADGEPFLTPYEQTRILTGEEVDPDVPDQCAHPGQEFQMALGRDPHTLLTYLPQNEFACLDGRNLAGWAPDHHWFDVREGVTGGNSRAILRCPDGPGPSCYPDPHYCAAPPPQGPICYYCNAEVSPSLCAFLNPNYTTSPFGQQDVLFTIALDPGYVDGWAGGSNDILRAWSGRKVEGEPWGIDGEIRTAAGVPLGPWFRISDDLEGRFPKHPDVAGNGTGSYLVAWQDDADKDGYSEIHARFVDASGPIGNAVVVSASEGGKGGATRDDVAPSAGFAPDGSAMVAWTSRGEDPSASASEIRLATYQRGAWSEVKAFGGTVETLRWSPRLAAAPDGRFALAWIERMGAQGEPRVMLQWFEGSGSELGNSAQVNATGANILRMATAFSDSSGNVRVEWETLGSPEGDGKYARVFRGNGEALTSETLLWEAVSDPPVEAFPDAGDDPIWE